MECSLVGWLVITVNTILKADMRVLTGVTVQPVCSAARLAKEHFCMGTMHTLQTIISCVLVIAKLID